ncbi:MAG: Ada metal-binding domain-containing protein [Lachnospiraceae bacterium]|jgi:hypothetical protein|nr:Ada metal-binding domain-containing protein [Lachnospiraceae bacterium]
MKSYFVYGETETEYLKAKDKHLGSGRSCGAEVDRSLAEEKRCEMTREEMVKICQARDKSYNGKFYLAVKSTKIVCNPGCSSRIPLEKNMVFFDTLEEALEAGYRPCKRC